MKVEVQPCSTKEGWAGRESHRMKEQPSSAATVSTRIDGVDGLPSKPSTGGRARSARRRAAYLSCFPLSLAPSPFLARSQARGGKNIHQDRCSSFSFFTHREVDCLSAIHAIAEAAVVGLGEGHYELTRVLRKPAYRNLVEQRHSSHTHTQHTQQAAEGKFYRVTDTSIQKKRREYWLLSGRWNNTDV